MSEVCAREEVRGVCAKKIAHRLSKDFFRRAAFRPWYYHRGILMSSARQDAEVGERSCWMSVLSLLFVGGQRQSKQDFKLSRQFWDLPRQGSHSEWRFQLAR